MRFALFVSAFSKRMLTRAKIVFCFHHRRGSIIIQFTIKCKTSISVLGVTQCFCCVTKIRCHIPHELLLEFNPKGLKSSGVLHIRFWNTTKNKALLFHTPFMAARHGKVEKHTFLQEIGMNLVAALRWFHSLVRSKAWTPYGKARSEKYFYGYFSDSSVAEQQVLQDNLVHFLDFEILKLILTLRKLLSVFGFLQKCKLFYFFSWLKKWENESCSVIHVCFILSTFLSLIFLALRFCQFL